MKRVGLDFNDERWAGLVGGYRIPYDPRPALRCLEQRTGVHEAWQELCTELYHQGDVGEASYAAVPHLVRIYEEQGIPDWNTYALIATIEEARQVGKNPDLPTYLCDPYEEAWNSLVRIGIRELESASANSKPLKIRCSSRALSPHRNGQGTVQPRPVCSSVRRERAKGGTQRRRLALLNANLALAQTR
jgi:hypothetical protein